MRIANWIFLISFSMISAQEWIPVWSDEFEYTGLPDPATWGYDVGGGGYGNQELQYYTESRLENASVGNGMLSITAKKESYGGNNYTSARLVTRGKGDWLYGKVEVRAKLPRGRGMWPAIWLLPTDWAYGNWPASGELDMMENVGYDSTRVHSNIHTQSYNHTIQTNKGDNVTLVDPWDTWHVYRLEWYPDSVSYWVDDTHIFRFANEGTGFAEWPFDKRFHLILNIAVGGTWGGAEGVDDSRFPQSMYVDYVRVFQQDTSQNGGVTPPPEGELVWNGGFSQAAIRWEPVGYYEAAYASGTVDQETYKVSVTTAGTQNWHVQFSQAGIAFEQGKTYRIRFRARSSLSRQIAVAGNQNISPWLTYGKEEFSLTTVWQDYSFDFTMTSPTDPAARLEFDLGGIQSEVWIDDASIQVVSDPTRVHWQSKEFFSSPSKRYFDLLGRPQY